MKTKIYNLVCNNCDEKFYHKNKKKLFCDKEECKKALKEYKNKKRFETNLKKYGTIHPMKNKKVSKQCHDKLKEHYKNKVYNHYCIICLEDFTTNSIKSKYCSEECKNYSEEFRVMRIQDTNIKNHGVINYSKTDEYKTKIKEAWKNKSEKELHEIKEKRIKYYQENYGTDHYSQTDEFKEKFKATCQERYNCDNVFQNDEVKEKIKETCIEKYNVDHWMKTDEGKKTISDIRNNRTDGEKALERKRCVETNKERYGTEAPLQNSDVYQKMIETILERYGVDNVRKINWVNDKIQESIKEYYQENYGVDNCSQLEEVHYKKLKIGFTSKPYILPSGKEIKIQGYENKFLDEYFKNGGLEEDITTQGKDLPEIWYCTEDGKKHRYFPDFYIKSENKIIEVKSEYTYESNLEINLLKEKACSDNGYKFEFKIY